jgi:nucleoside phosphorylase/CheY-like chemotaxis protein
MINILIVEDDPIKLDLIKLTINEINNTLGSNIKEATSINEAKKLLEQDYFDILIIDLVIPLRNGEEPNPKNCCNLIEEIESSPFLKPVQFIIGLTKFEELNNEFSDFFESRLFHLLMYKSSSNEWKSKLKKIIFHLVKLKEDFLSPTEFRYKYDAVFITALFAPEFEAVLELSENWTKISHSDDPSLYYETTITENGKSKKILAAFAEQMGMVGCCAICMKVILKFRPQYIFLTGITAGIKKENVYYGDVLIADLCWDYNSGKIVEFEVNQKDGEQTFRDIKFEPEPKSIPLKSSIKNKLLEFTKNKEVLFQIKNNWNGVSIPNELNAYLGPLATGSHVIASSRKVNEIKEQNRKVIGIEMEAYALFYACNQIFESKITPIVIKSICDFGDELKDDKYQKYASYTSVQFAKNFLFLYL